MTMQNSAATGIGRHRAKLTYQGLVNAIFAIFIFSGIVAFIEPSPYDLMAFIAFPASILGASESTAFRSLSFCSGASSRSAVLPH